MDRERLEDLGKLLLRLVVAGLMLFHGIDKLLHGPVEVMVDLNEHGMPGFLAYGVYVGEILAPALILAGVWTRVAAIVYSLSMVFATGLVHGGDFLRLAPTGAWAAELWAFYILTPVVVALLGPGRHAVTRLAFPWD